MVTPLFDQLDDRAKDIYREWISKFNGVEEALVSSWLQIQVLKDTMQIVRLSPDYDDGGPLAEMMDQALDDKIPETLKHLADLSSKLEQTIKQ